MSETTTTANIVLKSKESGLLKTLEKSIKSTKAFDTNTKALNDSFGVFNKTATKSDGLLKSISNKSLKTTKGLLGLSKASLGLGKTTVSLGESLIDIDDNVVDATSGISGFGLKLLGVKKPLEGFSSILEGPAGHLRDIAEASSGTERAFIVLNKVEKPLIKGLSLVGKGLDKTATFFDTLSTSATKGSKVLLDISSTAIDTLGNALDGLQKKMYYNQRGRKDSIWIEYHSNGVLKDSAKYNNGKLIKRFQYDREGKKVS